MSQEKLKPKEVKQLKSLLSEILESKQNIFGFLDRDILITRLNYAIKKNWTKDKLMIVLSKEICGEEAAKIPRCVENIKDGKNIDINEYPNIHPNIPPKVFEIYKKYQHYPSQILVFPYEGNFYLFFIKDQQLKLATFASPGAPGHKTPSWNFRTEGKVKDYVSNLYPGPMSRSIYLGEGGFFIHMGYTTGKSISHGCIRLPGIYSKKLFELISQNEKIPVRIYRK